MEQLAVAVEEAEESSTQAKTTSTKIPFEEVVSMVCGETGHWASSCAKAHPKFKAAKKKRENAKVAARNASVRKLVDDSDLRSQL